MTTREQAVQALFDRIKAGANYAEASRRLQNTDKVQKDRTPLLMLVDHSESFQRSSSSMSPIRRLHLRAIIYTDVGDDVNAIPVSTINNLLDALEVSLAPDHPEERCTLGGLVHAVMIDGEVIKAPGDISGKSVANVPIEIILP